jgi:ParB family transcriptional regulator, chromosome partitioning protein
MTRPPNRLGRGLSALLGDAPGPGASSFEASRTLPVEALEPGPFQPRGPIEPGPLKELADSIAEHGVLQPILVTPAGDRYRVIAGNRRLKAAVRAGLERVPAIVKAEADDQTMLLWNIVENIQRVDLSAAERVRAIRQLAAFGFGIREMSRGTGLSPATISKWTRIADKPAVLCALEEGRLDIFRAMELAPVKDPACLEELIEAAPGLTQKEFSALVRSACSQNAAPADETSDDERLAEIARELSRVQVVTPAGLEHLQHIQATVLALMGEPAAAAAVERSAAASEEPAAVDSVTGPGVFRNETDATQADAQRPGQEGGLLHGLDGKQSTRDGIGESETQKEYVQKARAFEHRITPGGKTYIGRRLRIGSMEVYSVHVGDGYNDEPLEPIDPNPSVLFEFGKESPGCLLLARSILADVFGGAYANQHGDLSRAFSRDRLARLSEDHFTMTEADLREWAAGSGSRRDAAP